MSIILYRRNVTAEIEAGRKACGKSSVKERNPEYYGGEVEKCDSVVVVGDYPAISESYKAKGIDVKVVSMTKAKTKSPEGGKEPAKGDNTDNKTEDK